MEKDIFLEISGKDLFIIKQGKTYAKFIPDKGVEFSTYDKNYSSFLFERKEIKVEYRKVNYYKPKNLTGKIIREHSGVYHYFIYCCDLFEFCNERFKKCHDNNNTIIYGEITPVRHNSKYVFLKINDKCVYVVKHNKTFDTINFGETDKIDEYLFEEVKHESGEVIYFSKLNKERGPKLCIRSFLICKKRSYGICDWGRVFIRNPFTDKNLYLFPKFKHFCEEKKKTSTIFT